VTTRKRSPENRGPIAVVRGRGLIWLAPALAIYAIKLIRYGYANYTGASIHWDRRDVHAFIFCDPTPPYPTPPADYKQNTDPTNSWRRQKLRSSQHILLTPSIKFVFKSVKPCKHDGHEKCMRVTVKNKRNHFLFCK